MDKRQDEERIQEKEKVSKIPAYALFTSNLKLNYD